MPDPTRILVICPQSFLTDGVVGLAFEGMSKIPYPTLLEALASANPAMDAVFAFRLTRLEDPSPSEFHFGGFDASVGGAQPKHAYFPVVTLPSECDSVSWIEKQLIGWLRC